MTQVICNGCSALLCLLSLTATANTPAADIQYLLQSVGQSGCVFIRNEKAHEAAIAESHLRMKYRNGKIWVHSAEQFIERIASKSSWSGKAYYIACPDADRQPLAEWMLERLADDNPVPAAQFDDYEILP